MAPDNRHGTKRRNKQEKEHIIAKGNTSKRGRCGRCTDNVLQTFGVPVDVGVWTTMENRPNMRSGRENRHRGLPAHQGKVTESKDF